MRSACPWSDPVPPAGCWSGAAQVVHRWSDVAPRIRRWFGAVVASRLRRSRSRSLWGWVGRLARLAMAWMTTHICWILSAVWTTQRPAMPSGRGTILQVRSATAARWRSLASREVCLATWRRREARRLRWVWPGARRRTWDSTAWAASRGSLRVASEMDRALDHVRAPQRRAARVLVRVPVRCRALSMCFAAVVGASWRAAAISPVQERSGSTGRPEESRVSGSGSSRACAFR